MVNEINETRYEAIKRLRPHVIYLIKLGFIPTTFLNWQTIYERYLFNLELHPKITEAIGITAVELNVSDRTVNRVIKFMAKKN